MMDIGNFQIDNLTNEEYPVLLGAKDYYDKKIYVAGQHLYDRQIRNNLATAFRSVQPEDFKERERDKHGKVLERLPFLRANFLMNKKTQENKLGAIVRYESIYFGMQELFIQVETTILNDNIKFIIEVLKVFGEKEDGEEIASEEGYLIFMDMSREQTCSLIDASKGIVFDEKEL